MSKARSKRGITLKGEREATDGGEEECESFTISGTRNVVRVGDSVWTSSQMVKIHRIYKASGSIKVEVKVYHFANETEKGKELGFISVKELFLSNKIKVFSAADIQSKTTVLEGDEFWKGPNGEFRTDYDYFWRISYDSDTETLIHGDDIRVFCSCEMPYNPDSSMLECSSCHDWCHPECEGLITDEAKKMAFKVPNYVCYKCKGKGKGKGQGEGKVKVNVKGKGKGKLNQ